MDQPRSERTATDRRPNGYADPSALVGFLKSLRSVRFFEQHKPVPENVLQDVLEVARWSGSARNRQPWEFVVVLEREMLESLAACEGRAAHLANAAVGIVLVMAGEPEFFEQETFDEGRLSERISLTAASYGVASSVGWFKGQGREKAKEILGIPQSKLVRTVLSLGYPVRRLRADAWRCPRGASPSRSWCTRSATDGGGLPPRGRTWMVLEALSAPKGVSSTPNARRDCRR